MPTWFCSRAWFSHVGPFDEGGRVSAAREPALGGEGPCPQSTKPPVSPTPGAEPPRQEGVQLPFCAESGGSVRGRGAGHRAPNCTCGALVPSAWLKSYLGTARDQAVPPAAPSLGHSGPGDLAPSSGASLAELRPRWPLPRNRVPGAGRLLLLLPRQSWDEQPDSDQNGNQRLIGSFSLNPP